MRVIDVVRATIIRKVRSRTPFRGLNMRLPSREVASMIHARYDTTVSALRHIQKYGTRLVMILGQKFKKDKYQKKAPICYY